MGPSRIWPKNLGKVFRGPWPTAKAGKMLSSTQDLIKTVREFRNRISHHEPVWKRYGVSSESDAIAHLHEKIAKIRALISIVSPEKESLIIKNGLLSRAERVCSINELRCCQHRINIQDITSISELCQVAQRATDDNLTQCIIVNGRDDHRYRLLPM